MVGFPPPTLRPAPEHGTVSGAIAGYGTSVPASRTSIFTSIA
jgi:hypothetical protein